MRQDCPIAKGARQDDNKGGNIGFLKKRTKQQNSGEEFHYQNLQVLALQSNVLKL